MSVADGILSPSANRPDSGLGVIVTDQEIRAQALALKEAQTVTLSDLQSYLGKAADLLRGSIDQADFKAFIFPLMIFKRISDVYM